MPAILAMAYHSLVGSSGPVSSASSRIGCGRQLGIDAGRAEEQQLLDAGAVGGMDDVRLDHQVVVEEIGGIACRWPGCRRPWPRQGRRHAAALGLDPAPRRRPDGADRASPRSDGQDRRQSSLASRRTMRRADHAAMPGDPDALAGESRLSIRMPSRASLRSPLRRTACGDRASSSGAVRSLRPRRRSATISPTRSANGRRCFQPSTVRPWTDRRAAGPTSVGRK